MNSQRSTLTEFAASEIGPVEIEEPNGIFWNRMDWPSYLKCPFNADLSSLIRIVQDGWCVEPPQIIISILSDSLPLAKWQQLEQIRRFQQGLVKAASSARTWLITNGLNVGAARITSEAIVAERNWQHSLINPGQTKSASECYAAATDPRQEKTGRSSSEETHAHFRAHDSSQETMPFDASVFDSLETAQNYQQQLDSSYSRGSQFSLPITKSVIIGVIDSEQIVSGPFFYKRLIDPARMDIASGVRQTRQRTKERHCIDQNHSHFIFVQKSLEEDPEEQDEQLLALELFYEISYLGAWITSKQVAKPSNLAQRIALAKFKNSRIPFTAILMQGDLRTANLCSKYLLKQIPVLVLQGTGGFADLLAYAYLELDAYMVEQAKQRRRSSFVPASSLYAQSPSGNLQANTSSIPVEYVERVLKPTLTRNLRQAFPAESKDQKEFVGQFLDKILECVQHGSQEGVEYLTVLNVDRDELRLESLNEHLLHNYLKRRQTNQDENGERPEDDLKADLRLTIEWNNYKTAKQLLERQLKTDYFTVDKTLFLDALTRPDREQFVELFLEAGFKLRSIYTRDTLTWLMEQSSRNHLFLLICCQNVLGLPLAAGFPVDGEFVAALNRLIQMTCKLTNFVDLNELTTRYHSEPNCLEQKALIFFTLWSVFNFKDELTKRLWPFSAYPVHLLLVISKALLTISRYSYDLSIRKQLDEQVEYFNGRVLELLDVCHAKCSQIAIRTISDRIDHWNGYIAVDIAASIKHHQLIAHQSAQKWLDYRLMNGIHLRHSGLGQFVNAIKVFLSVLLVFPILCWLDYPHLADQRPSDRETRRRKPIDPTFIWSTTDSTSHPTSGRCRSQSESPSLPQDIRLRDKWLLLVTSPMSKYVAHLLNWLLFLLFFSFVVIRPGCGDVKLDLVLFAYLAGYYVEMLRKSAIKYRSFMFTNVQWQFSEFALVSFLLFFFFHDRLNPFNPSHYSYNGRMALLVLLFLAYLKLLSVFMPMFNTLAPLSYRIRMMSLHDVKMFVGLVWPFMVAFGVIIEAALYPDRWLFADKLVTQSFLHRTVITLFRTPYSELLNANDNCDQQHRSTPFCNATHCQIGQFDSPHCNNRGFFSHFYLFAYIFFLKLVMLTLLHALFNASALSSEMNTIWRYQRFFLITDFDLNHPLPPPFCVLFYLLDFGRLVVRTVRGRLLADNTRHCGGGPLDRTSLIGGQHRRESRRGGRPASACHCSDESIAFFWRTICRELVKRPV